MRLRVQAPPRICFVAVGARWATESGEPMTSPEERPHVGAVAGRGAGGRGLRARFVARRRTEERGSPEPSGRKGMPMPSAMKSLPPLRLLVVFFAFSMTRSTLHSRAHRVASSNRQKWSHAGLNRGPYGY